MTVTHELGHVIVGLIGGAKLTQVELRPWHLPHSMFAGDTRPLVTLWAGPLLGSILPLIVAALIRRPSTWFIAWFCLLANGAYLLLGYWSGDAELDSSKMLQAGTPTVVLIAVAALAVLMGYLQFRRVCADWVSGREEPFSPRLCGLSAAALLGALALQSLIGSLMISML